MLGYVAKRILATIPVMLIVAVFVFLMLRLAPGDPAAVIAGDYATTEDVERIREQLGLNEPIPLQLAQWVGQLVQGDLGESIFSKKPVTELIGQRIEPTLLLALTTIVFSVLVAVPLGTHCRLARRQHCRSRRHAVFRRRLLRAGLRAGLYPDLRACDPAQDHAGAGLQVALSTDGIGPFFYHITCRP